MSLTAAAIRIMAEKGLSSLDIAEIAEALEAGSTIDEQAERRRRADRERKREERERLRTVCGQSADKEKSPHNPPKENNTPHSPKGELPPKGGDKRGTRLPNDFTVPRAWLDWAMAEKVWSWVDAKGEAAAFCDYWQAKSGAAAVKLDWEKTWRNWVRNSRRKPGMMEASNAIRI